MKALKQKAKQYQRAYNRFKKLEAELADMLTETRPTKDEMDSLLESLPKYSPISRRIYYALISPETMPEISS
jgi:DNA repair ATPase RecN